jgi:hypothetical protein
LRSPGFDLLLVGGTAGLGIAAGLAVFVDAALFAPILLADLWLLGYHHVISTFTRTAFDSESFQRYRHLLIWLPFFVIGAVVAVGTGIGLWMIPTVYLYWQWWHYTRQSYGVAQLYRRKAGGAADGSWGLKSVIYGLPLVGILYRSEQASETFLGLSVRWIPMHPAVVIAVAVVVGAALLWWSTRQWMAWRGGQRIGMYQWYLLSHLVIFALGYLVLRNINHGWLVINVWHNAQYVMIVWLYNNNRFKSGVDPAHRFLSTLSQGRNVIPYLVVCLAISTVAYLSIGEILGTMSFAALPLALIAFQTVNFHHYIVDGIIWKVRRPAIRANLVAKSKAA